MPDHAASRRNAAAAVLLAALRFAAGLGLAGELGAGITLVSELMPKDARGYGTMMVAAVGIVGGVVAGLIGDHFNWRTAYFIGGGLGAALLALSGLRETYGRDLDYLEPV